MQDSGVVNIHGKEYKTVALRVRDFRQEFPKYSIETDIISNADLVIIKAVIRDESDRLIATGYAEEVRGSTNINKTSALENCETSAIGRALACLGLGGTEYASANEVSDAIIQQAKIEVSDFFIKYNQAIANNIEFIYRIKEFLANEDIAGASAVWADIERGDRVLLVKLAPSKGGIFTTEEREIIKLNKEFASSAP